MNHVFTTGLDEEAFVRQLMQAVPFRDGSLILYQNVPVKCLRHPGRWFRRRRNLNTMDLWTSLQCIDFLVCRGEEALLGITFDLDIRDSRQLFGSVLWGLAHEGVELLDFSAADLPGLIQRILTRLEELDSSPPSGYALLPRYVGSMPSLEELKEKRLLHLGGYTTLYGRDCGLCFRVSPGEGLTRIPVVAGEGWQEFLKAVNWSSQAEGGNADALRALLGAAVETLFRDCPEAWETLTCALHDAGCSTDIRGCSLQDTLLFLRQLVRSPGAGSEESCSRIRRCIPQIHRSLAQALRVQGDAGDYEILRQSLHTYYRQAALLTESYYPLWKFRMDASPFLNGTGITLAEALENALHTDARPMLEELLYLPLHRQMR